MNRFAICCLAPVVFVAGPTAGPAAAQTDLSRFSLVEAAPPDAFVAVCARTNPERKFLEDYWSEVIQAFHDSGVLTDIWDLITDRVDDEDLDAVEDVADRLSALLEKVDFGALFDKEFLYAARFETTIPGIPLLYEGVMAGRSDKKQAQANYEGLTAILNEVVRLIDAENEGAVVVREKKEHGATVAMLGLADVPGIGFGVAVRNDVIVISLVGESIMSDTLARLAGSPDAKRLTDSPRFKSAFAQLPPAEDTIVFFDIDGMLGSLRTMLTTLEKMTAQAGRQAAGEEDEVGSGDRQNPSGPSVAIRAVGRLMEDLSIFDYLASVEWTDGYRVFSDTVTPLKDGAKSSPLYGVFTSGKPFKKFETFVPKEAESFTVSAGISLPGLYRYLVAFFEKSVPGAAGYLERFEELQKEWELDIEKDVLGLIDGASVSFTVDKDWVLLLKVTDERKVEKQLDRLIKTINDHLGPEQSFMLTPVKMGGKRKLRQVSHPMMMMAGILSPPVIGCAEGYLVVGSSAKTVRTCLNTADGEHPNITRSRRWRREAIVPDGAVISISFTDETEFGRQLQEMIGGLSMGLGMVGMMGAMGGEMPPEVQGVLNDLPMILAKLGPVAGKLDFYQSSASYETFDGRTWYARAVQNYKKPKKKKTDEAVKQAQVR